MPFSIVRDDLANQDADAVIVSANEMLAIDGGNGYALASKVGLDAVQRKCDEIGGCAHGNAVSVRTGDPRNPLIIFAVGPIWVDGEHGEPAILRDAVANALREAEAHGARTIALPLVSTGAFGVPPELALQVTVSTIRGFLRSNDADVTLVLYDRDAVRAAVDYGEIRRFIDDNYVDSHKATDARMRMGRIRFDPITGEPIEGDGLDGASSRIGSSQGTYMATQLAAAQAPVPVPQHGMAPGHGAKPEHSPKRRKGLFGRHKDRKGGKRAKKGERTESEEALRPRDAQEARDARAARAAIRHGDPLEVTADALEEAALHAAHAPLVPTSAVRTAAPSRTWEEYESRDIGLEEWLGRRHDTFTVTLLRLIDMRGMSDSEVYKRANMSRQLFSKIRSDRDYRPKKKTVLALAVALELDLRETRELLDCAGYSLSQSSQFDLIIEYFIRRSVYDCFEINEALFAFGEELLN